MFGERHQVSGYTCDSTALLFVLFGFCLAFVVDVNGKATCDTAADAALKRRVNVSRYETLYSTFPFASSLNGHFSSVCFNGSNLAGQAPLKHLGGT